MSVQPSARQPFPHGPSSRRLRIALTPGEPAGIGPDICIQLAWRPLPADVVVIADPELLRERAAALGLPLSVITHPDEQIPPPGTLKVLPVSRAAPTRCGTPDPANARYVLQTLERAVRGCLSGEFAALVTGPVHKGVINTAGIAFTGHTEYLAALTGTARPVMMLATPGLRVALVTTHLALRKVFDEITPENIESTLSITERGLREQFGIERPRLAVCGLNPHAGEDGHLGTEERDIIIPVLKRLRAGGMHIEGPLPADTAFVPEYLKDIDAVVAMYHDQGLPVLKHLGFGTAINVTLGLPIIRTSVDHGTALNLAGSGRADTGSLQAALTAAVEMASRRPRCAG